MLPVSWAAFVPIFTLIHPSVLDLGSGMGQTDRRTDRQRPSMRYVPTLWGVGIVMVG